MANEVETVTYSIEGPEGDEDDITVPAGLLDMLREEDETRADVLGDMAMLSLAQQAHAVVHHGHGDTDPEVEAYEETAMDLFEERFGVTFGEMTGHSH
ncbi:MULTISPECIES: DUF7545 family protein [Halorussus]|uniref:DUF7545 family protein n=1 Tax=Halorussus TaxID=1070314 RepID=UPI00209D10A9|nr:hypothetical protein [Halorussus vallis]USZ76680.1 hypothetical protein NGM07_04965 [Halorussus vallis]